MQDEQKTKAPVSGMRTFTGDLKKTTGQQTATTKTASQKNAQSEIDMTALHLPKSRPATTYQPNTRNAELFDIGHASGTGSDSGTIVTDKKESGMHFGTVLAAAAKEMYRKAKRSVKKTGLFTQKQAPTVESHYARTDIIKAAGERTKQAPHDDHKTVVQKLRTLKKDLTAPPRESLILKKRSSHTPAAWSRADDTSTKPEQPRETETEVAARGTLPQYTPPSSQTPLSKPADSKATTVSQDSPAAPIPAAAFHTPTDATTDSPKGAFHEAVLATPDEAPPPTHEQSTETAPSVARWETARSAPTATSQQPPTPVTSKTKPAEPTKKRITATALTKAFLDIFHVPKKVLIAAGIAIAVTGGVGAGYMLFNAVTQNSVPTPVPDATIFVRADVQVPIPLTSDRYTFLTLLRNAVAEATGSITQLYPVHPDGTVAEPQDILNTLQLRAPGSFVRAFDTPLLIGSVAVAGTNHPFIIATVNSFDAAFAGIIAWEPVMSEDLAPLFGTPVLSTSVPEPVFKDMTVKNKSVRILRDQVGDDRILYSFIDRNTLIITTQPEAFTTLLERLK